MIENFIIDESSENPEYLERIVKQIQYIAEIEKTKITEAQASKMLKNVIASVFSVFKENNSMLFKFLESDYLIKIIKLKTETAIKQGEIPKNIKFIHEIPSDFIGTKEAAKALGVNIRRIYHLISSGQVKSKTFKYGNQMRLLIVKNSLYDHYTKKENGQ